MKMYKNTSYAKYQKAQERKNQRKIERIFACDSVITAIANYIKENIDDPKFGICHGVRNGIFMMSSRNGSIV